VQNELVVNGSLKQNETRKATLKGRRQDLLPKVTLKMMTLTIKRPFPQFPRRTL